MQSFASNRLLVCLAQLSSLWAAWQLFTSFIKLSAIPLSSSCVALGTDKLNVEKEIERGQVWPPEEQCGFGIEEDKLRIVNGIEARRDEFPSFVALTMRDESGDSSVCGGTIISRHHILTAAHCLKNKTSVEVKHPFPSSSHQPLVSTTFCMSSDYKKKIASENDYGIVKLNESLRYSFSRWSACLPEGQLKSDVSAAVVGLGRIDAVSGLKPALPQTTKLKAVACPKDYAHYSRLCAQHVTDSSICKGK